MKGPQTAFQRIDLIAKCIFWEGTKITKFNARTSLLVCTAMAYILYFHLIADHQRLLVGDMRFDQHRPEALLGDLLDRHANGFKQPGSAYLHPLDVDNVADVLHEVDLEGVDREFEGDFVQGRLQIKQARCL